MYSRGTMRSPRESIDREGGWGSSRREEALATGAETRASEERGAKWRGGGRRAPQAGRRVWKGSPWAGCLGRGGREDSELDGRSFLREGSGERWGP